MRKIITLISTIFLTHTLSADLDIKSTNNYGVALEFGSLQNPEFVESGVSFKSTPLHKTIGWLSQESVIQDKFKVNMGIGGMFFYFWPEDPALPFTYKRSSAISLSQVSGEYMWGEADDPSASLTLGLFPYKYNPNSKNLGEYLFRSKAYPNVVYNGSWDIVNSASTQLWGTKLSLGDSKTAWKNDFFITMNTANTPLYDISLSYITEYSSGPVTIGAGIIWDHVPFLSLRPSKITPEKTLNAWADIPEFRFISGSDTITIQAGKYYSKDSVGNKVLNREVFERDTNFIRNNVIGEESQNQLLAIKHNYYTFESIKPMLHGSINVSQLFTGEKSNNDLLIYGESIILGVKDHPVLYDNIWDRIPVMFGASLPTFGLLDQLSIEGEYWSSPYYNSDQNISNTGTPTSLTNDPNENITEDNIKWSIFMEKKFLKRISIMSQIANDHVRPVDFRYNPVSTAALTQKNSWYYMFRIQANL
jgi:hypothetical protein